MEIPLVGGSAEGRSTNASSATCINWFVEKTEEGESLVPTPGATEFSNPTSGEVRGCIAYNDLAYFVIGNSLYEIDSQGDSTFRGNLNSFSGRVAMAHNGTRQDQNQQIMIVDGTNGYIYNNDTQTLVEITDEDFKPSNSVVFLDGYFIFNHKDTDRFAFTGLYDGENILFSDIESVDAFPDNLLNVIADRRELFLFCEQTVEIWYNSGNLDNTFQRFQGGMTEMGCVAAYSPAQFDNSIVWLARNKRGDGMVCILADNYRPEVISTQEINYQIAQYSRIDDAFGYAYQDEGHEFYVLTFPTAKVTWCFDAATRKWHQRAHVIDDNFPNRERYNCHTFAMGKHLLGDFINGKIYEMSSTEGEFMGERIPRERTTISITDEENRTRISSFQLDMQEGIGDPNGVNDADMWLSYSKDGGHTFSDEVVRSAGKTGKYATRLMWRKLGKARNWIFRIRTWSPNKPLLKGAFARFYGE